MSIEKLGKYKLSSLCLSVRLYPINLGPIVRRAEVVKEWRRLETAYGVQDLSLMMVAKENETWSVSMHCVHGRRILGYNISTHQSIQ